jgi:hypothetical protein
MELAFLKDYWQQLIAIITLIIVAVKLSASVKELRKDVDDILARDTFVETTKLIAQVSVHDKQISALWLYVNKLRDMFNGVRK